MAVNKDTTQFDYIIVGAGSAGSVLADRLSADGRFRSSSSRLAARNKSVSSHPRRIREDACRPESALAVPLGAFGGTGGREIALPQGSVYGGSSSLNGLVYNRGQAGDFNTLGAARQHRLGI